MPHNVLIVGATRGLGLALTKSYAKHGHNVYGTARSPPTPDLEKITKNWIPDVNLASPSCSTNLLRGLSALSSSAVHLDIVILTAGYFSTEDFGSAGNEGDALDWDAQVKMYTISAIAPPHIVAALVKSKHLGPGSKVLLVTSESGSITLRAASEGGGNFGHHGSKAAENMVSKLLSLDLKERGVAVGAVHPGFMRTEMTKGVGFDQFYEDGGAVTPEVAAESLVSWIEGEFGMGKTGEYWAPRGARDIGTAEEVLGKDLPGMKKPEPMRLPW